MKLCEVLRSKLLRRLLLVLVALLVGGTIGTISRAQAGDPGGDKTGAATDAQNAPGEAFIVSEPDAKDPEFAKKKEAFDEFTAMAEKEPLAVKLADFVGQNRIAINLMWTLVAGFLVMFMQAGFALVETGLCRAKNASHTMLMNFLIYVIGLTGFWMVGFALMYGAMPVASLGGTAGLDAAKEVVIELFGKPFGLFASNGWFLGGSVYDVGVFTIFLFQMVFMDTAATIPTGAMAERWKLSAFFVFGFFMSMVLYPLFGNWAWGGGWLSQLGVNFGLGHGYADFAGSGVVHSVGGLCALAGAIVLGPRLGKYNRDGTINPMPAHHIPMALLGAFILAFGWFGFNPGSTLGVSGGGLNRVGIIAVATMLAGAGGALSATLYMVLKTGKPDPTMIANGLLAGLVAITAPSGFVGANAGFIIGAIAGVLVCAAVAFFDKLRIDDPVGAISVHGVCGLFGVLCVGIFADGTAFYGGSWNGVSGSVKGLLYGDWGQFGAQVVGCITLLVWAFGGSLVFFKILDMIIGMRVSPEVEQEGLDLDETGVLAYPYFSLTNAYGVARMDGLKVPHRAETGTPVAGS
jgi:ammonium transporter, Amt family